MLNFLFSMISIISNLQQNVLAVYNISKTESERLCLRVAENQVYQPAFRPKQGFCEGWFCWQSQLTLAHKMMITDIINTFRNQNSAFISNMNLLVWHWALEQEAIRASRTCSKKDLEQYMERRFIDGLGYSLLCENGCIYKELNQNPSQILFLHILPQLLQENGLQDFDEYKKYRRANAQFFGCCLVIRNAVNKTGSYTDVFNFVCVFCTKEKEIASKFKLKTSDPADCPLDSVHGGNKKYPKLCQSNLYYDIFSCPPKMLCPDLDEKPAFWENHDEGIVVELIFMETVAGPVLFINQTQIIYDSINQTYEFGKSSFYLDASGEYMKILDVYPIVTPYVYYYGRDMINSYNETVRSLGFIHERIIDPITTEEQTTYVPVDAVYSTADAWCCFYLFVASLTSICVLVILTYYTSKKIENEKVD